jgi:hypothetical protein
MLSTEAAEATRIDHVTYPCPHCGAPASDQTGCPSCGRGPDADAAEVIRTDAEISTLIGELATARRAVGDLEGRIGMAWQRRNAAAARVRAAVGTRPERRKPETSTRAVQNVLFVLGGLLLGVAAIVFTAVAWAQFGVAGRATVLGFFTVVALTVPLFARRRGLTATAETMAAVGVLLLLLDGYAARHVNLFGMASVSPARYAGAVCVAAAAIAAAYAAATGLTGPRFAALLVFQPAVPLLVARAHPGLAGWSLTFGLLAAFDLAVRRARVAPAAYACAGLAVLVALAPAVIAAGSTLATAQPFFHTAWTAAVPSAGWRLPAALALVTAAVFLALPRWLRPVALVAGASSVAVALPAGLHLPWWNGPILDLVVVTAALALAVRHTAPALATPAARVAASATPAARVAALPAAASPSAAPVAASWGTRVASSPSVAALTASAIGLVSQLAAAVLLGLHAVAVGLGRPGMAAGVLTAVALLGAGTAVTARARGLAIPGVLAGLASVPAIAWTGTAALGLSGEWQHRAVTIAFGAILVAASAAATAVRIPADRALAFAVALVAGWGVASALPAGTVLEAYTLPASGLALAAALIARRDQPRSWVTYGPALSAGLLPSLVSVLADDGQQLRRLLLGLAALAILLAGGWARLRAPVVAGGVTLAVLALHELTVAWELIPRWIPLAAGGVVLVLLAATLERRRRDLTRVRAALGRMS